MESEGRWTFQNEIDSRGGAETPRRVAEIIPAEQIVLGLRAFYSPL